MNKYFLAGIISVVTLVLDQVTKIAVREKMVLWTSETVIPGFFNLVHVVNKGAAFGFLNRADITWQRNFFVVVTIIALGAIGMLLKSAEEKDKFQILGLGFVLGGAIGNLIDRILYHQVTDFLDFYYGSHHYPAFNVADIAICLGAFAMIVSFYKNK
ncbi:signal peptidase II [Maridesulfovibrio salexigens]|uniref:Lipoprotein signal peptidase n=1 Tax=Maridesulfovibrio salexigens (strain ATCC 14822 / DSM 2638 / NCIMB 8403 / VKM B-1763) TaxID=526222 RepID=LSPA_MARSD|nr:signal peptidase II [Maridesulfovibrio salexigens]C6BV90.1 RecName: Full=Lipoprotein signal peptidase; AltName: Full=Prolipoprotein signal peptidase; AltName: Full=Signal peptidase II; Short=SPase II [Maridesulfovibrio salexigens DSM 2638]ACS80065.1 lipoprotein signal peptidase [Maridesulfovibrio salexigens DSM 2638]